MLDYTTVLLIYPWHETGCIHECYDWYIEGVTEEFSSSILDIQLDNNLIILDELFPKHGNNLLINKKIKLSTIHNGIRLALMLSDVISGSSRGIAYYKSAYPQGA